MDRFSSYAIRFALVWMLLGVAAGAAMMTDALLPGNWLLWLTPTHAHVLLVGWFFQFTLGVAYWLLPRRRSPAHPVGYDERLAFVCLGLLNFGLATRVVVEPLQRAGFEGSWVQTGRLVSAAAQFAVFSIVAFQLWPRVAAKNGRGKTAAATPASPER